MTMKLHQAKVTLPTPYWFINWAGFSSYLRQLRISVVTSSFQHFQHLHFPHFLLCNGTANQWSDFKIFPLVLPHMHETDSNVSSVPLRKPVSLNPLQIRGLDNYQFKSHSAGWFMQCWTQLRTLLTILALAWNSMQHTYRKYIANHLCFLTQFNFSFPWDAASMSQDGLGPWYTHMKTNRSDFLLIWIVLRSCILYRLTVTVIVPP